MTVLEFPAHKVIEKQLKDLEVSATKIYEQAEAVQRLINQWENTYLDLGEEYIKVGGKDPDLINKFVFLKSVREKFGIFK
jgi:hypothetical protein